MSKSLDQLAKNLASGMSRRKAFWSFLGGVGAIGALSSRKALANGRRESCGDFCEQQADIFRSLCIEASQSCGSGSCAEFTLISFNGGPGIGFNGSFNGGPFICVPVYRG
jgi:hypothetical protein